MNGGYAAASEWSVAQSFVLTDDIVQAALLALGSRAPSGGIQAARSVLLKADCPLQLQFTSASEAVSSLQRDAKDAPQGFCAFSSKKLDKFVVLYRSDKRQEVLKLFSAQNASQAPDDQMVSFYEGAEVTIVSGEHGGRSGTLGENYGCGRWWVKLPGEMDRMIEDAEMALVKAEATPQQISLDKMRAAFVTSGAKDVNQALDNLTPDNLERLMRLCQEANVEMAAKAEVEAKEKADAQEKRRANLGKFTDAFVKVGANEVNVALVNLTPENLERLTRLCQEAQHAAAVAAEANVSGGDPRHDWGATLKITRCTNCSKLTRNRGDKETGKIYCVSCYGTFKSSS